MKLSSILLAILAGIFVPLSVYAQQPISISAQLIQKVIEWRRDLHQPPGLSNREFSTAKVLAAHLESLSLEV
jgi:metal-dependent amidase/aminoacylase/carboxypeptidase family protein